jgi:methyl-accepting chemotaxis protein
MEEMKPKSKYSLQRTMMVYFLLIGFAVLLVGIEFIVDTHAEEIRQAFLSRTADPATIAPDHAIERQPLVHLRNKSILMIGIIMVVILIVMTMFMKHITEPLQHMITASRRISGGDLSQTIRIEGDNELAELGGVINEMASNLQEIIHLSRNTCASGQKFLTTMNDASPEAAPNPGHLTGMQVESDRFRSELDMLQAALECFHFYVIPEPEA